MPSCISLKPFNNLNIKLNNYFLRNYYINVHFTLCTKYANKLDRVASINASKRSLAIHLLCTLLNKTV